MKTLNWFQIIVFHSLLLTIAFSLKANAEYVPQETDEIVVMRDGKVIGKMTRKNYKVVKIEPKTHTKEDIQMMAEAVDYQKSHHSIILMGGVGRDGLDVSHNNDLYQVSQDRRPVVGGTYCYTMTKTGVCATALTNETYMLGIKRDFNLK